MMHREMSISGEILLILGAVTVTLIAVLCSSTAIWNYLLTR